MQNLLDRLRAGGSLNDLQDKFVELLTEAWRRESDGGVVPYDHQLGAVRVFQRMVQPARGQHGVIAELPTGTGKTLPEGMTAGWLSLEGRGVHIATHDEEAAVDHYTKHAAVLGHLGIRVGLVKEEMPDAELRAAYRKDITIGQIDKLAHDYLRDQKVGPEDKVQRGHRWLLIDEVDHALVDTATSPDVIAEPDPDVPALSADAIDAADQAARSLKDGVHYRYQRTGAVKLTPEGKRALANFSAEERANVVIALRSAGRHQLDRDHFVADGKVVVHSERTGRGNPQLRFTDHRWVEARNDVMIGDPQRTIGVITRRQFLKLYDGVGGLTATAEPDAALFWEIYRLRVEKVDAPKPDIDDLGTDVYLTVEGKLAATADAMVERLHAGQPVAAATLSIPESKALAAMLTERGVKPGAVHALIDPETQKVTLEVAGRRGAATVGTQAIARAVDIKLGGDKDQLNMTDDEHAAAEKAVVDAGGLHGISTRRAESPSGDIQVKGRPGRDGKPGSFQEKLSLNDPLLTKYAPRRDLDQLRQDLAAHQDELAHGKLAGQYRQRALELFDKAQKTAQKQHIKAINRVNRHPERADTFTVAGASKRGSPASASMSKSATRSTADTLEAIRVRRLRAAADNVDRAGAQLAQARGRIAAAEARDRAGAPTTAIDDAAAVLRDAQEHFDQALGHYREVLAEGRDPESTPPTEANPTMSPSDAGVTDEAVDAARRLADTGDYQGAIEVLAKLANSAAWTNGPDGRRWGGGAQTSRTAGSAATVANRLARTHATPDAGSVEHRLLTAALNTLNALLATLPAGARVEVPTEAGRRWQEQMTQDADVWTRRADELRRQRRQAARDTARVLRQVNLPSGRRQPGRDPRISSGAEAANAQARFRQLQAEEAAARAQARHIIDQRDEQLSWPTPNHPTTPPTETTPDAAPPDPAASLRALRSLLPDDAEPGGQGSLRAAVDDLEAAIISGALEPGEVDHLLAIGGWRGQAAAAQYLGEFARRHSLHWTKAHKRALLTALRQPGRYAPDSGGDDTGASRTNTGGGTGATPAENGGAPPPKGTDAPGATQDMPRNRNERPRNKDPPWLLAPIRWLGRGARAVGNAIDIRGARPVWTGWPPTAS